MDKINEDIKDKKKKDKKKKDKEVEDDAMSMMSDMTMDTQAQNEEPATALNDAEKDKWQAEVGGGMGQSWLGRRGLGAVSGGSAGVMPSRACRRGAACACACALLVLGALRTG